jgi:hypothetical protein
MAFTVLGGGAKDFSCMETVALFASSRDIFVAHPERITGIRINRVARGIAYLFIMAFPSYTNNCGSKNDSTHAL